MVCFFERSGPQYLVRYNCSGHVGLRLVKRKEKFFETTSNDLDPDTVNFTVIDQVGNLFTAPLYAAKQVQPDFNQLTV